jgi:hypothetical protein
MWESLPIQRDIDKYPIDFSFIERNKQYFSYKDVEISRWKDVPTNIQTWCLCIWKDHFQCMRNPAGENDFLFWIPQKGMLLAKYGHFIGSSKSRKMIYVCYNFICEQFRGERLSEHLILTMANVCTENYGPITFMFELQNIPASLRSAVPIMKFTYVWIPFLYAEVPPKWKPTKDLSFLKNQPGFHSIHYKGYKAFEYNGEHILFDPANDIVYYENYLNLFSFDGLKLAGAYCRVFNPFGNHTIFVENMYFHRPDYFVHNLLV